jgi:hypothetical protein
MGLEFMDLDTSIAEVKRSLGMTTVTFSTNVQAAGGPQFSVNRSIEVEAYDRIEVKLDPTASGTPTPVVVHIQPSPAAKVAILALTSNVFGSAIKYKVSDGTHDSPEITLDQPQVFAGSAVGLFTVAPNIITLTNADAVKAALIEIFVGRKAT